MCSEWAFIHKLVLFLIISTFKKPWLTRLCFLSTEQRTRLCKNEGVFSNGGERKRRSHQSPQTTWLPQPSFHLCSKQTLVAGLYVKQFLWRVLHISVLFKSWYQQWQYFGLTLESSRLSKDSHADITTAFGSFRNPLVLQGKVVWKTKDAQLNLKK